VTYDQKFILVFMQSTRCYCEILIKIEISLQMFEKYSNFKIPENPWEPSCSMRTDGEQTDRH